MLIRAPEKSALKTAIKRWNRVASLVVVGVGENERGLHLTLKASALHLAFTGVRLDGTIATYYYT